jgi:uncharacterized protein YjbI with pentapeptide repeats
MQAQTIEKTQLPSTASYELIKEERLSSLVITSQILAGSRILRSTYRRVVFSDCVFYACSLEGVIFDNCIFENCRFEFSHFRNCELTNCNFSDCNWMASSSVGCFYSNCDLDSVLLTIVNSNQNQIMSFVKKNDFSTNIYIELAVA